MKYIFYSDEVQTAYDKLIATVNKKPGLYIMKLTKANRKRSLSQNAYYWGVVIKIIADHSGYTSHEVHQWLAGEFLSYQKAGRLFAKSTTELDTMEFERYLERCRIWAQTEQDLRIPLPNEVTDEMYDQLENIQV
jgi:hypothetical protein